jgi:hypothetical protein
MSGIEPMEGALGRERLVVLTRRRGIRRLAQAVWSVIRRKTGMLLQLRWHGDTASGAAGAT